MTMESKIEAAQKLIEEVKAELAAMRAEKAAPPRNWPERIEAGDCFEDTEEGKTWLCCGGQTCVCVIGPDVGVHAFGFRKEWAYRGRDILSIRPDAHEPTGAELRAPIPDGAEWVEGYQTFYKGRWPNMRVWSSYGTEPNHWCEAIGSHEKNMRPISEWLAR